MAAKRKTITKKTRFEVFKRDGFKCQYCGAMAPDVPLVIDHIDPISKGGADSIMNYVTACQPCNAGKSDRALADDAVVKKQQNQLTELNERREQLEMLLQWKQELLKLADTEFDGFHDYWHTLSKGYRLNESGAQEAKVLLSKYGLNNCLAATDFVAKQFVVGPDGTPTSQSVNDAWRAFPKCVKFLSRPKEEQRLYYIRGILRNRMNYVGPNVLNDMKDWIEVGFPIEEIEKQAKRCRNYTQFEEFFK